MICRIAPNFPVKPLSIALAVALHAMAVQAQTTAPATGTLKSVTVEASADASAEGLSKPYAGGQVARGGRIGILGNQDIMDTPFSGTNYTHDLIQNQQARSIGDVLQNDPAVRVARGFGNYQQVYIVRGLPVYSDDMAYNGLYGLLPRQYLAAELVERVEVLRGASAFLNGAAPGGSGLGGAINVMPKRAPNEPLTSVTLGLESGTSGYAALDLARRFGIDGAFGLRVNAMRRDGKTEVNHEKRESSLLSLGMDYRSSNLRVSADLGYQDYQLQGAQPSVTFAPGVAVQSASKASRNIGQPWTYSTERDTFGTVRAEYDLNPAWTVWGAYGGRRGDETNDLANPTVTNAAGALNYARFTGTRADRISTGEVGLRGNFKSGDIGHTVVLSAANYHATLNSPYAFAAFGGVTAGTLNAPVVIAPAATTALIGTQVSNQRTSSVAVADTVSLLQDKLRITLGARQQSFKDTGYDRSSVTPIAGIVYKFSPMVSVYGSYVEGLIKGDIAPATNGFPAVAVVNGGQIFAPYETKQTEAGVKVDTGRFGGTFSVFTARKPLYSVNAANVFGQTDTQKNSGTEASVFGEVMPGLKLLGGASFLKAVVNNGNRAIGAPKTQFNIGTEWDVPGVRGLSVEGRVVHTGSQFADAANTQVVPSWTRVDLGARYMTEMAGKLVTFRARVENAANKDYWASAGGYPGASYLVLGAPRTFSVNASVDF